MRFITPQPTSPAEVEATILPGYLREYKELADGLGSFAAIEKETGQMAGRFSLKPANSYGLVGGAELGYRLYPAFWGRGLATDGLAGVAEDAGHERSAANRRCSRRLSASSWTSASARW